MAGLERRRPSYEGVTIPRKEVKLRQNHNWTEEERQIIRRDYRHTFASKQELATRLGVSPFGVAGQVAYMGIARRDDRRPWSPEEKERVVDLIQRYCPRRVARLMHRSLNSVVVKSKRLGASRRIRNGWFTKAEVCQILGMGHKWVQRRIDSGVLVASHHSEHRPSQNGGSTWHIEEKAIKDFLRRYPEELNGRNVDLPMIVDILAGISNNQH